VGLGVVGVGGGLGGRGEGGGRGVEGGGAEVVEAVVVSLVAAEAEDRFVNKRRQHS